MADVVLTDKLKDFPTKYNNDISSINDELHFKQDGSPTNIKYTGTATISGDLNVTGNITSTFNGNIDATNVVLSGGNNLESELNTITNLNTAILDQARDFERRAENIRKVTPSGFTSTITNLNSLASTIIEGSNFSGLGVYTIGNNIFLDNKNEKATEFVVNGYVLKMSPINNPDWTRIDMPAPPTTGTRQDLVFIEAWKEEVDKETGLFFPYGNTQYASSDTIDGSTLNNVQAGFTGSAYFTSNANVYCVRANVVSQDFLANPDHNVGVLDNGNFFQVRYRIRVEADILPSALTANTFKDIDNTNYITPQGQLSSPPVRGLSDSSVGRFVSNNTNYDGLEDNGYAIGCYFPSAYNHDPITGLSLDGFTYAIPVCAVHRRNTGVYSLGNQNGNAYINTTATFTEGIVGQHTATNSANSGLGGDTFYDDNGNVYINLGDANGKVSWQLIEVNGSQPTTGNSFWFDSAKTIRWHDQDDEFDIYESWKYLAGSANKFRRGRPDGLFADIIDRRDVLDLRHKVSLNGKFDEDELYQETFDLVLNGNYRQEWQEQKAYDADGNGLATIDSGIYGNVLLETLGLGATVPDAHINTNITKVEECNNGTPTGFNGARSQFSDAQSTEDYTAVILDQSSPSVLDSADNIVTYNTVTKTISIDMTQHSSYVNDLTKDPTILEGHLPVVKWGTGTNVAGVWTRTNDYNWTFEVKEYGAIAIDTNAISQRYYGDIYRDPNGNDWKVIISSNGTDIPRLIPDYSQHNGSVLPSVGDTLTLQSGHGVSSIVIVTGSGAPEYISNTGNLSSVEEFPIGYSNSAHGTSSTESIFSTIKLDYKAGSSCLPELPYGDDMVVLGGKVFIDGTEVAMPEGFRPMGGYDKATKTVKLNGFSSRKPVLDLGPSGSSDDAHLYHPSVIKDGSTYKMWYGGHDGTNVRMHYATSTNGIDWDKQGVVVDLGSNGGTDDWHIVGSCVIKDGGTYKMWYGGSDSTNYRIHYATSSDGISWSKQGVVVDIGSNGSTDDKYTIYCSVVKDGGTYKMWYTGHDGSVYRIHYATSSDGITWSKQGVAIPRGESGDYDSVHNYTACVIKDGSLYRMTYSGSNGTTNNLLYAISSDGINWIKKGLLYSLSVSGGYDDSHIHSMCFIKDGSSYKAWTWGNNNGTNWRIGYSVLAMSDPNNTGTSTTGVYTNTNPQVNFGFTSNDTVVLHYERMAQQGKSLSGSVGISPKNVFFAKGGTGNKNTSSTYRDFMSLYTSLSSGTKSFTDLYNDMITDLAYVINSSAKWTEDDDLLVLMDVEELQSEKYLNFVYGITQLYVNGSINKKDVATLSNWNSGKTSRLQNISNLVGPLSATYGGVGVATHNSELYIGIGGSYLTGHSGYLNMYWHCLNSISMIGRPLIK